MGEDRDSESKDPKPVLNAIEGCIEKDEVAWRGIAEISELNIESIDFPYEPRCPRCTKEMTDNSYKVSFAGRSINPFMQSRTSTRSVWECPDESCGHSTTRESRKHTKAKSLFEGEVRKIIAPIDDHGFEVWVGTLSTTGFYRRILEDGPSSFPGSFGSSRIGKSSDTQPARAVIP